MKLCEYLYFQCLYNTLLRNRIRNETKTKKLSVFTYFGVMCEQNGKQFVFFSTATQKMHNKNKMYKQKKILFVTKKSTSESYFLDAFLLFTSKSTSILLLFFSNVNSLKDNNTNNNKYLKQKKNIIYTILTQTGSWEKLWLT